MVAASIPSRSIVVSVPLASRIFERMIGRLLVLMIHAVERQRDRRLDRRLELTR
jgi:hypothetical protein